MTFRGKQTEKPTLEEIKEYIEHKHLYFDPIEFYDYYEGKGWKRENGAEPKTVEALISVFNAKFLKRTGMKSWHKQKKESCISEKVNMETGMRKFIAYTDGSCDNLDSNRPGGAAYIIFNEDMTLFRKASKGFCGTTNNRMELLAIISVVNALPKGSEVTIYTDSQYCIKALNSKKPKMNLSMIAKYHQIAGKLAKVTFEWVKGHEGNIWNEECDRMANGEYQKMKGVFATLESLRL